MIINHLNRSCIVSYPYLFLISPSAGQPHTVATDVWSLGAVAAEMALGQPFADWAGLVLDAEEAEREANDDTASIASSSSSSSAATAMLSPRPSPNQRQLPFLSLVAILASPALPSLPAPPFSPLLACFLTACFTQDPARRPPAALLLLHPFLSLHVLGAYRDALLDAAAAMAVQRAAPLAACFMALQHAEALAWAVLCGLHVMSADTARELEAVLRPILASRAASLPALLAPAAPQASATVPPADRKRAREQVMDAAEDDELRAGHRPSSRTDGGDTEVQLPAVLPTPRALSIPVMEARLSASTDCSELLSPVLSPSQEPPLSPLPASVDTDSAALSGVAADGLALPWHPLLASTQLLLACLDALAKGQRLEEAVFPKYNLEFDRRKSDRWALKRDGDRTAQSIVKEFLDVIPAKRKDVVDQDLDFGSMAGWWDAD